MCVLVISESGTVPDPKQVRLAADRIRDSINWARHDNRPIAHVMFDMKGGFEPLGIGIGRYEPVFGWNDHAQGLPQGLIDFIVAEAHQEISLVGAAAPDRLDRLCVVLNEAGFATHVDPGMVIPVQRAA